MIEAEALLTRLFEAYNRRDFSAFAADLCDDIDWPDQTRGGRLVGHAALRDYWDANSHSIHVEVAPIAFAMQDDGRVRVDINQVVRGVTGSLWSDIQVRQYYTLRDGQVSRMDVEHFNQPPPHHDTLASSQPEAQSRPRRRMEGAVTSRVDGQQDGRAADASVEALLSGLYDAIDRQDIDAVMALFEPDARIPDSLESDTLVGHDQIRAYYLRQFATIQVSSSLLSTRLMPDDRIAASLHVQVTGSEGGMWGEGRVEATYRIHAGKIREMVVDSTTGI
ncbi:nuclear transport factor 2 family protein [Caulobacter sp. ErkDOM-YI]|uniref:nuclear transport factor 2 family protein n=1 Tax=unclassified Caulobacter TaxID=2648921 RepID=UPI003AF564A5